MRGVVFAYYLSHCSLFCLLSRTSSLYGCTLGIDPRLAGTTDHGNRLRRHPLCHVCREPLSPHPSEAHPALLRLPGQNRRPDLQSACSQPAFLVRSWAPIAIYYLGVWADEPVLRRFVRRYGRYLFSARAQLDQALQVFGRHGQKMVFFGRMIPVVRSLISVPAGLNRMPLGRFILLTLAGSTIWNTFLTGAGGVGSKTGSDGLPSPSATNIWLSWLPLLRRSLVWFGRNPGAALVPDTTPGFLTATLNHPYGSRAHS